jgi:hypothetical protein
MPKGKEAEAAAKAFVEKELPTVANRINWQPASRIRWGKFRANEPLILQTAGYVVAGELSYGGIPLLNDTLSLSILGENVISLSLRSHEIIEAAAQSVTIRSCRLSLIKSLAEIKRVFRIEKNYAILNARLVYAGPLDLYSKEAMQELILYRPMWQVVFHTAPGRCACGHIRVVYLDAVSGDYVGCHAR